jgi:hypothetical protein
MAKPIKKHKNNVVPASDVCVAEKSAIAAKV